MLMRQRVVLQILRGLGGLTTRLHLTKLSFLFRMETPSGRGASFYDFLPHRHGPFSFCLYHEVAKLVSGSLLEQPDEKHWRLGSGEQSLKPDLPGSVVTDITSLLDEYESVPLPDLVALVYRRYPWYTINSVRERRESRPVATPAIYTLGYEGCSVDGFLNGLMKRGVKRLVDVRSNPVARRYGFHKSTLMRLCGLTDIEYLHIPELGISSDRRKQSSTSELHSQMLKEYEDALLPSKAIVVEQLSESFDSTPTALVCMERDPLCCHRSRLAEVMQEISGLQVEHLHVN